MARTCKARRKEIPGGKRSQRSASQQQPANQSRRYLEEALQDIWTRHAKTSGRGTPRPLDEASQDLCMRHPKTSGRRTPRPPDEAPQDLWTRRLKTSGRGSPRHPKTSRRGTQARRKKMPGGRRSLEHREARIKKRVINVINVYWKVDGVSAPASVGCSLPPPGV